MEDTAATCNFLEEINIDRYIHNSILIKNVEMTNDGIEVLLINKGKMKCTHTCNLDISELPKKATNAHTFKELSSRSLLSI